jgi:hypothetical protein
MTVAVNACADAYDEKACADVVLFCNGAGQVDELTYVLVCVPVLGCESQAGGECARSIIGARLRASLCCKHINYMVSSSSTSCIARAVHSACPSSFLWLAA